VKSRDTETKAGVLVSTEVFVPGHTPLEGSMAGLGWKWVIKIN